MGSLKRQREEACYICGHYHNYEGGEQCKVCGHVLQTAQISAEQLNAMPTEVLPSFLYVGSYDHASRAELLKAMGITHILSVVPSCQRLYRNSFVYHTASTSPAEFQECFDFLEDVRRRQGRVLVHCMTGMTRSCEMVIAYLIKLRSWTLVESMQWVKDRHKSCVINQAEFERLQACEHFIRREKGLQPGQDSSGNDLQGGNNSRSGSGAAFGSFSCSAPNSFGFGQPQNSSERFVFGAHHGS